MMAFYRLLLLVIVATCSVSSEKILAVLPVISRSHFFIYQPVLEELARRGHDVTVISPYPRANPLDHYIDIHVQLFKDFEVIDFSEYDSFLWMPKQLLVAYKSISCFEKLYEDERIGNLINSTATKFDLVITELFLTPIYIGLSHRFQAPLIEISSTDILPWAMDRFGIPDNPSYVKFIGAGPMTFFERIGNTFAYVFARMVYRFLLLPEAERVSKKYLGNDVPLVRDLAKRSSLYLVNSHVAIHGARALPPQIIEIGGIHIKPTTPLPQDIEKFINESEHGVVYFSFGSMINASSMSEKKRKIFCGEFAKLKQRVLWKWELDELPGKPDNVKTVKWAPQGDILAHPNVRVFISHGGLLGAMEGVYNGVPILGIPLAGDAFQNIEYLEKAGMAVTLDCKSITEESLSNALSTILEDPKYEMNAKRLSKLFRDRPSSPLDKAVYWVEYVMKHNGAHHLRTAAVDLPWYQYFLVDVIGAVILVFVVVVSLLIFGVKFIFKKISRKRKEKTN